MIESLKRFTIKLRRVAGFGMLHLSAIKHANEIKIVQNNLKEIRPQDIILFSVMKNETHRLSYFVDYYRKLGVGHFIFVDNDSTDGFNQFVSGQNDITTYHTAASYKDSNFGVHWLNHLLSKHGVNHWCLTCDPDEFFVYPKIDTRTLRELTEYLDANYVASFYTLMIDMYSECPVESAVYSPGQDPLEVCPYFDMYGYTKSDWAYYSATSASGGVRRRVFFETSPGLSPALNKVPLVKWRKHFVYALSTHIARPNFINYVCQPSQVTGALLHFKFFSDIKDKVAVEMHAKQHWDDSIEYKKYDEMLKKNTQLYDASISHKYENWWTLAEVGLINIGDW
jgi:hypothetical protein